MKAMIYISASLILCSAAQAQEVVSVQGGSYSNSSGFIDFTIGEVVIATGTNGTQDITQGFHQTNWNFLGVKDHNPDYTASVFPNPSEEVLNIQASKHKNVKYTLYDAMGKNVAKGDLAGELTTIPVAALAPGKYFLALNSGDSKLKVFKLIKNQ